MKKILITIIFTLTIQISGFGQKFIESNEFELTKFEYSDYIKLQDENKKFDGYMSIFIMNKKGVKFKEIKVYGESYENDATVKELKTTNYSNIKKIIQVYISECACNCNTSIYYWLITNQNEWIPLPTIELDDYEFEMKYKDYVFSKKYKDIILLKEYQDERIDKKLYTIENIRKKSEKVIKTLLWNGKKIKEK